MPRIKMTEKALERLRPPEHGRVEYFDAVVPGLCLRVTDKGRRTWSVLYRLTGDDRKRRHTLGPASTYSLTKARDAARRVLRAAAEGHDPAADKARQRRDPALVETCIEDFTARHLSQLKDGRQAQRILERDVLPVWGRRRLKDINRRDVLDLVEEKAKTAPVGANRTLAWIRKMMAWAVNRGMIEWNPALQLPRPTRERSRERVLTDAEIRTVWLDSEAEGYPFGAFVQFLLVTGQRRGEVRLARWEDIEGDVWTLPDSKAGRVHEVPLTEPARRILDAAPRHSEFIFSARGGPLGGLGKAKSRIAPKLPRWTLHDCRRTFASNLARLGVSPHTISQVLGHAEGGLTGPVHVHYGYLKEKRAALELWADRLESVIREEGGPADVVALAR